MILKNRYNGSLFVLWMIIISIATGIVFSFLKKDCGLQSINKIDDLKAIKYVVEYSLGDNPADENIDWTSVEVDSDTIMVVKPTGNIVQTNGSLGQEFIVENVLKSATALEPGEKCLVYAYYGFVESDGQIIYNRVLNLMNPNRNYLLFANESPLNNIEKKKSYILADDYVGYIAVDHVNDNLFLYKNDLIDYNLVEEYEFFSSSQKITDELNLARNRILNKWLQ